MGFFSNRFYGWRVVAAGGVLQFLQAGMLVQSFGAYVAVLSAERGWSKTALSGAAALQSVETALIGPVLGWLIDRFGEARLIRLGVIIFALGLMVLGGWWAAEVTALHMGIADPGHIVVDEIVAIWLVLWLAMPMGFWGQAAAFALFRFFDAAKPQPVRWADQLFKGFGARGAWGIMFDDLVAAFCTLLVIALWRF